MSQGPYDVTGVGDLWVVKGPGIGSKSYFGRSAADEDARRLYAAYTAGLASRDAEIVGLRTALQLVGGWLAERGARSECPLLDVVDNALAAAPGPVSADMEELKRAIRSFQRADTEFTRATYAGKQPRLNIAGTRYAITKHRLFSRLNNTMERKESV